jgi:hypothetical protein
VQVLGCGRFNFMTKYDFRLFTNGVTKVWHGGSTTCGCYTQTKHHDMQAFPI